MIRQLTTRALRRVPYRSCPRVQLGRAVGKGSGIDLQGSPRGSDAVVCSSSSPLSSPSSPFRPTRVATAPRRLPAAHGRADDEQGQGPGYAARRGQAPPGHRVAAATEAPKPTMDRGRGSMSRARAASRYPDDKRAGWPVRSDRLPQVVRASRSCDHPRTGWGDRMDSVSTSVMPGARQRPSGSRRGWWCSKAAVVAE